MSADVLQLNFSYGNASKRFTWREQIAFAPTLNLAAQIAAAGLMYTKRLSWLSADCNLDSMFIHTAGPPRDVYILPGPFPAVGGIAGNVNTIQDYFGVDFYGGGSDRTWFAHGIPDTWVAGQAPTSAFTAARAATFDDWVTHVKSGSYGIQVRTDPSQTAPIVSVITSTVGSPAIVTLNADWNFGTQSLLQIRGYRGDPNSLVNGFWKYLRVDLRHLLLVGSQRYQFNAPAGGIAKQSVRNVVVINGGGTFDISSRDVGDSVARSRGKTPAQLFHR